MNRKIMIRQKNRLGNRLTFATLVLPFLVPMTVYAGNINGAEQGILSAISEEQEYQGAYYKVTDGYYAKVTEYLSRDNIDMSQQEANDYIAQFHANIAVGVSAGYMEKVGDVETADPGTENGGSTGTDSNGSDSGTGADASEGNGTGNGTDGTGNAAGGSGAAAGGAAGLATVPEGDGPVEDNTVGSTSEGAVEYVVLPMDEETMYVQGIEELSVHEEAYKDAPVIGEIKEGEPVKVTGAASTGWAQIAFGEKTGYVSAAYLRTQGYMDKKEAEKKAAEEEARKAEEEARKAAEAEKAAEEAAAAEAEAQQAKDYSNAQPVEKSINLGMIALGIVVVCVAALGGVLFYHKKKSRFGKR